MAKIIVAGKAVVVEMSETLENLKLIEKYRPEALKLMGGEENKEEIFRIVPRGNSLNKFGAGVSDASPAGMATITLINDYEGEDFKGFIADEYGLAISRLKELENNITGIAADIVKERKEFIEGIQFAQDCKESE